MTVLVSVYADSQFTAVRLEVWMHTGTRRTGISHGCKQHGGKARYEAAECHRSRIKYSDSSFLSQTSVLVTLTTSTSTLGS